ncbi:hypothetical protein ACPA9J_08570 [Pseudomonas aeruginosa]
MNGSSDRLGIWGASGDEPLMTIDGGKKRWLQPEQQRDERHPPGRCPTRTMQAAFLEYPHGLPPSTQQTFQIMIMIPIGVLVILIPAT